MSDEGDINQRGNHQGNFTLGVGGWAEYTVYKTEIADVICHDLNLPPGKVIPVIFLPGIMGSNLRMTKRRQEDLKRGDNRAWRPDDMMTMSGQSGVFFGEGFGGWYKLASPEQRQLVFDPNETEVEYYHYTEHKGRFDPDGRETLAADARHSNIPDSMPAILPLLGTPSVTAHDAKKKRRKVATPAQLARWRGWSEILFQGAYGNMLKLVEKLLNNMTVGDSIHRCWKNGKSENGKYHYIMELLWQSPTKFGATSGSPISESDIRKISQCWYPVHAMGYNFLKSNGESAVVIAERIRGLVKGYKERNFNCDEVIIITHSMGGLLARALLHPKYGNLSADPSVKVLGMYHNVMPTVGAAATYKRMRFGFLEPEMSFIDQMKCRLFGVDGQNATAVLANASGPLELLPSDAYGCDWLRVVSGIEEFVGSWPSSKQSPSESIYTQPAQAWWRLVNPSWVNPARKAGDAGGGLQACYTRIEEAYHFTNGLQGTFHPTNSWVSYCASHERRCYGNVSFTIMNIDIYGPELKKLPPPHTWKLISDDGIGKLLVQAGSKKLTLQLKRARDRGDETVPADRSAQFAKGFRFVHGVEEKSGYEHQNSYMDQKVLASMLYSIVKIAQEAKWE